MSTSDKPCVLIVEFREMHICYKTPNNTEMSSHVSEWFRMTLLLYISVQWQKHIMIIQHLKILCIYILYIYVICNIFYLYYI